MSFPGTLGQTLFMASLCVLSLAPADLNAETTSLQTPKEKRSTGCSWRMLACLAVLTFLGSAASFVGIAIFRN